jgi:Domain of unknown function (DUF4396)
MEAHAEHSHHHHELPTEGSALTGMAVSATLHCLTGCAIGEVAGVAIGTALGWSDLGTIALAIGLAFLFGYALTSLPLLRAGLALAVVIPIALASDTLSIATMELVDNLILLIIPGAMDAGLGDVLFWGALSFALFIAFLLTVPVNRYLLARGKGHAAVHETGIHGGPPVKLVGAVVTFMAVFGSAVLIAEAASDDGGEHGGGMEESAPAMAGHEGEETTTEAATHDVPGLAIADGELALDLARTELPRGDETELSFRITEPSGEAVTDFDVEHDRRMHVIVARRDLTGFQHLHPRMAPDGTWTTSVNLPDAGAYRVFADFTHDGENTTLGGDLTVDGAADYAPLPAEAATARTDDGYTVRLDSAALAAGETGELAFAVERNGEPVEVEPYLGADGHLVALREGDLGFLHVHPVEDGESGGPIRYEVEFPTEGSYRLFLQFKDDGRVHTAAFTRQASTP